MSSANLNENQSFNLINGKFEPIEVAPLVSILFNAKIEYHNRKILKLKETNKRSFKEEEERVLQLEKECKSFQEMMQKATDLGYDIIIKGDIHVQFIDKNI